MEDDDAPSEEENSYETRLRIRQERRRRNRERKRLAAAAATGALVGGGVTLAATGGRQKHRLVRPCDSGGRTEPEPKELPPPFDFSVNPNFVPEPIPDDLHVLCPDVHEQ